MITLTPAYQRDYKSKAAVQKDRDLNKDFIITDMSHRYVGKYANKADLANECAEVLIRYDGLRKIAKFKTGGSK